MGHEEHGVERLVGARPAHENAVVIDARELECREGLGIEPAQCGNPLVEGGAVEKHGVIPRDGGDAQQGAESLDGVIARHVAARIDRYTGGLGRLEREGADHARGKHHDKDDDDDKHDHHELLLERHPPW